MNNQEEELRGTRYAAERIDKAVAGKTLDSTLSTLRDCLKKSLLFRADKGMDIPAGVKNTLLANLDTICGIFLPHFSNADSLALKYQFRYKLGSILIYLLSALAVVAVAAQSLFRSLPHEIVLIEVVSIVIILVIIRYGNSLGWHRRWLDYRMLAELFRFAVFLAMAGEKASVNSQGRSLYDAGSKKDWIFACFSDVWLHWEELRITVPSDAVSLEILKKYISLAWLEDQRKYHLKNVMKHLKKHKRYSIAGETLFFLTLLASVFHYMNIGGHALGPSLTFLAISMPATGAAFSALRSHFEHNRLARRSEKMAAYLRELELQLVAVDSTDGLLRIVQEAQALMLNENSEWYVMIGFRKMETPA